MVREVIEEFDILQRMELMQEAINGMKERMARWESHHEEEGGMDRRIRRVEDTVRKAKGRIV